MDYYDKYYGEGKRGVKTLITNRDGTTTEIEQDFPPIEEVYNYYSNKAENLLKQKDIIEKMMNQMKYDYQPDGADNSD